MFVLFEIKQSSEIFVDFMWSFDGENVAVMIWNGITQTIERLYWSARGIIVETFRLPYHLVWYVKTETNR
jgi:hypothetical protein